MTATLEITLTFRTPMLGTAPSNPNLYSDFVAAGELAAGRTVQGEIEHLPPVNEGRPLTVFRRDDEGRPCLLDYQIKGFLKETCTAQRRFDVSLSKAITAHKAKINDLIFIGPQYIPILNKDGTPAVVDVFERPLRAETPQGPRVTLTSSERVQAGTQVRFSLRNFGTKTLSKELLKELFAYGQMRGLGQFRSGTFGTFAYVFTAQSGDW